MSILCCAQCGRTKRGYSKGCWNCGSEGIRERERPWRQVVHNHGPEQGAGLACRERKVDGRLIGECLASEPKHVAPNGQPLRGYYPGVECEHGYDACPICDAVAPSPAPGAGK